MSAAVNNIADILLNRGVNTIIVYDVIFRQMVKTDDPTGLKGLFSIYYEKFKSEEPDEISKREIGFIPFEGTMKRHVAVENHSALERLVKKIIPRHLYYSSTYYRKPWERKMDQKEWLGAELIFDLDADHIEGAQKMRYEEILERVKEHTMRLIGEFLTGYLGFDEKELKLYFSGGRGYHVHVVSEKVYELGSDARREISNLVRGEGLNRKDMAQNIGNYRKQSGWFYLVDTEFTEFYRRVVKGEGREWLSETDWNKIRESMDQKISVDGRMMIRSEIFTSPGRKKFDLLSELDAQILDRCIEDVRKKHACEIDEPVTTDVHRLIRYPLSLHGKSGMMVKPVPIENFDQFQPLNDAIPDCFDFDVKFMSSRKMKVNMMGKEIGIQPGEAKIPAYAAAFFAGMGAGQIISIIN